MSIYSISCPTIGCYQNFQCDPEFLNKVVAVAFIKKGVDINKSTPTAWKTDLLQAMADGDGYIVFNTSGEKPRPETATTAGRGMQTTKALAKTHTVNVQDMSGVVANNIQFYNDMLSSSSKFDFYYFTPGRIWDASGSYVTVIGDPVITAELNTYQMAEVSITWVSKTNPLPYQFDTDTFLEGLYFNITADAPYQSLNWYTSTCTPFGTDMDATLNVSGITTATQVWSFGEDMYEAVPGSGNWTPKNWIGTPPVLTINASTGGVNVLPENGYGSFTIRVQAGCIFGEVEVKLLVEGC